MLRPSGRPPPATPSATVTWTAPASNGGDPITGYVITPSSGSPVTVGNVTSDTITGLTNGTAYTFKVAAINAVGTGAASAASNSVTPAAPATVPGAPTIGTATAGNASATVSWTAPASNGGDPITGYVITPSSGSAVTVGNVTSDTVTGLTNGTAYTFKVAAINAVGTGAQSAASNSVTPAAPATVPGAPTIGTATAGNASATVTWTAPASNGGSAITGYVITPSSGSAVTVGNVTSDTVTGLTNGTAYTFTVAAINAVGTGAASAASNSVTPPRQRRFPVLRPSARPRPATPRPPSPGRLRLPTAAIRSPATSSPHRAALPSPVGNVTSDTVTGLTNGTAYTFTVAAINAVGTGAQSAASNSVTPAAPATVPGAPTIGTATAGNASATVTWTAPTSNGGDPITGYVITPSSGSAVTVGNVTSDTVTGLTNGTAYTFKVAAINAVGTGAQSAASNSVTLPHRRRFQVLRPSAPPPPATPRPPSPGRPRLPTAAIRSPATSSPRPAASARHRRQRDQ